METLRQAILDLDHAEYWLLLAGLAAAAAASFYFAFRYLAKVRLLADTPTSRIRSAAQGYVELRGEARLLPGPPVVAPLTGCRCCWYRYRVEERVSDYARGARRSRWRTIARGESTDLFLLVDATGACVVDPEGARVTPAVYRTWYGSTPRPLGGAKKRVHWWSRLAAGRYRYREERLDPGDPLYALGLFRTVGGAGSGLDLQADVAALVREWKRDSETLLARFDRNRDGEICLEEWAAVRDAARAEVLARHRELQSRPPIHTLGETRDRRRPFLLAARDQGTMVADYRQRAAALVLSFVASSALLLWILALDR